MKVQQIWSKYGKSIVFPAVIVAIAIFYFVSGKSDETATQQASLLTPIEERQVAEVQQPIEEEAAEQIAPETVVVDVKGAVKYPGVVQLTTEDRVMDAIEAVGGYTEVANPVTINHAQKLVDEMVIYVPAQGENLEELALQTTVTTNASSNASNDDGKVNLNTATEAELTTLPGIGPSKAAAILAYREENGGFKTIEDLKNVSGIGDKTFEKLQDAIKVK